MADRSKAAQIIDRTGQRYGKLTVLEYVGIKARSAAWLCRCECGSEKVIGKQINEVQSCGCARKSGKGSRPNVGPRLPVGEAARKRVLRSYRESAQRRGLPWALSERLFDRLTGANCAYCGSPPSRARYAGSNSGVFVYNGIDRIDNARGYSADNVVACCTICNNAKMDMSVGEFKAWIARLVARAA